MPRPPTGPPGHPAAAEPGDRPRDQSASEALAETCDAVERELDELRARYELFFLGVERVEPARDRALLKQRVARLLTTFTRNAGLRFRVQALHARFISYERLWTRSAREREEGTYRRDVLKARRRAALDAGRSRAAAPGREPAAAPPTPAGPSAAPGAPAPEPAPPPPAPASAAVTGAPAAPLPSPAQRGPPPPATPRPPARPPEPEDARVRALYEAYVAARRQCNEDVSRLSYDAVARTVAQQEPLLREKLKAKAIEFKVVIQGGRAVLKALPRG